MATSPYDDTALILNFLGHLIFDCPASVLDIGAGFGRWGYLLRCHMASGESLTRNNEQNLRVEAVEAFAGNITPIYDCVYNRTHVGDVCEVLPSLGSFDVIIASHILEHLPKDIGLGILDLIVSRAKVAVVICLPFGEWPQDEIYGNPYEVHKSTWRQSDFKKYGAYIKTFGRQAAVIIPINTEAHWYVKMMNNPLRRLLFRLRGVLSARLWRK